MAEPTHIRLIVLGDGSLRTLYVAYTAEEHQRIATVPETSTVTVMVSETPDGPFTEETFRGAEIYGIGKEGNQEEGTVHD